MIVTIDPGHYKGANIGLYGHSEGTWAWGFAQKLGASLENEGFDVVFTRTVNTNPSLEQRGKKAEKDGIFISLHSDAGIESACGATCFYPYDGGYTQKNFAASLVNAANKGFGFNSNRSNPVQRKQYFMTGKDYYAVMRSACTITDNRYLLECGFHTNPQNVTCLDNENANYTAARMIAAVFAEYFPQQAFVRAYNFNVGPATGVDAAEIRAFLEQLRAKKGVGYTETETIINGKS